MTNAPRAIVVFVPVPAAGSQEPLKRMKPPPYPRQRDQRQHWSQQHQAVPRYTPPADQIEAIKRAGKAMLEQARSQRAAHG